MNFKIKTDITFMGVAMALIIAGAALFAIGLVCWILSACGSFTSSWPGAKIIGGMIVIALGYILLELEIMRRK